MAKRGPAFYDDDDTFATYTRTRESWPDNPNDTLEQPILRQLVGDLSGRRILDLGCGTAAFGVYAMANGARSYLGIDGSWNMIGRARTALAATDAVIQRADLETWDFPNGKFDLVVSSLVLHYIADLERIFAGVARALTPGGLFAFSIEHPVITASDCDRQPGDRLQQCVVDDYFSMGARETTWLGGQVVKYHRTIEAYVGAFQRAGFAIEQLRESAPERIRFTDEHEYDYRKRVPLFFFLRGHASL